jgi:hypothetical protein
MNTSEELKQLVLDASVEEKDRRILPCPIAFKLAEEHGVELLDIARICNNNKIKIVKCQLGCF